MTNRADRAAITRSAWASIVVPTPIAAPFTAAINGVVSDDNASRNGEAGDSAFVAALDWKSLMSLPEVKVSPAPLSSTTRIAGSLSARWNASTTAAYIAPVRAFFFSGRLNRISSTEPASVTATSVMGVSRFWLPESDVRHSGRTSDSGYWSLVFSGLQVPDIRREMRRTSGAGH